jgi:hypothetical protein
MADKDAEIERLKGELLKMGIKLACRDEIITELADALSDSDSHWLHKDLLQRAREAVSPSNGEATKDE